MEIVTFFFVDYLYLQIMVNTKFRLEIVTHLQYVLKIAF